MLLETPRQPYQAHFNSYRHPRIQPAIYSGLDRRAVRGDRARRHAQPAAHLRVAAGERRRRKIAARDTILSTLMRRAYRRPVTEPDLQRPLELYRKARDERRLRGAASRWRCRPCW